MGDFDIGSLESKYGVALQDSPAPASAPANLTGLEAKYQPPAPSASGASPAVTLPQNSYRATPASALGSAPGLAIPSSPLNVLKRGAFGMIEDPVKQQNYLSSQFGGDDNVKLIQATDKKAGWVVKNADDGKWYQLDPTGMTDWHMADLLPNKKWSTVLKDLPGSASQFTGEHMSQIVGAAAGVEAAAPGIATISAASGPFAPITGTVATLVAAGTGAMTGKATSTGFRMAAQKLSGIDDPFGGLPTTTDEAKSQLASSFLFGAVQEATGMAGGAILRKTGSALGKALDFMAQQGPQAKASAAKLVGLMGNLPPEAARVVVENPTVMGKKLDIALSDEVNQTDTLSRQSQDLVGNFLDKAKAGLKNVGRQFDQVAQTAQQNGVEFDPSQPLNKFRQVLEQAGFVDSNGKIRTTQGTDIGPELTASDKQAIGSMLNQKAAVDGKMASDMPVSYNDMRQLAKNLEKFTTYGDSTVSDNHLRALLTDLHTGLKNATVQGLHEYDPGLAQLYTESQTKWSAVKDLVSDLNSRSETARLPTLMKAIQRDDGSYNSDLLNRVSDLLGHDNPTQEIIQNSVAKKLTPIGRVKMWGSNPGIGSPRVATRAMEAYGGAKQTAGDIAGLPYISQAMDLLKSTSGASRDFLTSTPESIDAVSGAIGRAMMEERAAQQQFLQQGASAGQQQQVASPQQQPPQQGAPRR